MRKCIDMGKDRKIIINDKDNIVTLIIDNELKGKKILVHPNTNTKTIVLSYDDLIKFMSKPAAYRWFALPGRAAGSCTVIFASQQRVQHVRQK